MNTKRCLLALVGYLIISGWLLADSAVAGMPSLLPEDVDTLARLSDTSVGRLQAISFFLLTIVIATLGWCPGEVCKTADHSSGAFKPTERMPNVAPSVTEANILVEWKY